jgi:hypothetical protein
MPIKMERRYEPGTQKYYIQKHAKNRRLVNKKKTLLVEYRQAVEKALRDGTPLPEEPNLILKRTDSEECLFADNVSGACFFECIELTFCSRGNSRKVDSTEWVRPRRKTSTRRKAKPN